MADKPSAEEIKEIVSDETGGVDDDEWDQYVSQYSENFGDMATEGFVAWAVALSEYDVHIESDYDLPSSSSGSSGMQDDLQSYDIDDLDQVNYEDDEQIIIEGLVSNYRKDTTSKGSPQRKFGIRDRTGSSLVICSGERNVESLEEAGIEDGDYIEVHGAQVFHPEPDDEDDDPFYAITLPYWAEITVSEEKGWDEVAKDYVNDIVNEGDYVHLQGIITSANFNEYTGCEECMKKVDPEEDRVCKKCGHDQFTTYEPGSLKVTHGDENVEVSFPPYIEFTEDDPVFSKIQVLGTWDSREYDGTEYWELNVDKYEILGDTGVSQPSDPDTVSTDDGMEDPEESSSSEETEDTSSDSDSETTESEVSDTETSSNGTPPDGVEKVKDKVEDFGIAMPAKAGVVVLQDKAGMDDDNEVKAVMEHLRDKDDEVDVLEEDGTVEDEEWSDVMLEWAG